MAEGLDQAASAFANEISPGASPAPRDAGGRFTARPETMFEPRPVEGDALTGDTRDGGEDARLAARERRIADGRAEQGDEQVPRRIPKPKGAGNAASDNRHQLSPDEQARVDDKPEHDDQQAEQDGDAEAGDEQGDAEGASEQDAETPQFEVTVDGKTETVSLNEALRGYIREATFHQRMNKVAEARQAVEADHTSNLETRNMLAERLQYLDRMIQELIPPPPQDWDREFATNPQAAREKQKAYETVFGKIQHLRAEYDRNQAEARADYDRRTQKYAVDQFSQFVADANIPDEKTLNERIGRMRAYGQKVGFSEGELATVFDKRMLRVLDDAAQADAGRTALPKAVQPGKGKTLTPGVATPVGHAARRSIDEAQQKLAKTGRLDDAALVFSRLIR